MLYDAKHGNHTHFELITVEIILESNLIGVGYTYTGGKGGSAIHRLVVDDLAPTLIGQDADKVEQLWEMLNWHVHFVGRGGLPVLPLPHWTLLSGICEQSLSGCPFGNSWAAINRKFGPMRDLST